MSRKGPRGLTREEQDLWDKVAKRTNPIRPETPKFAKASDATTPKPVPRAPIEPFQIGERHTATAVPSFAKADTPAVRMDKKAFGKLKRGKLKPDARIDLHGMTLAQAHPVLNRFIGDAHARGHRLVLVITGKGKDRDDGGPIPTPRGILKRQVPEWLRQAPLSLMVLQVAEAHLRHGGGGAFYVYLKRR